MIRLPPQEMLLQMFDYDPLTGLLIWRHSGRVVSRNKPNTCGHLQTRMPLVRGADGKGAKVLVHRIIWKMMHGVEPPQIDHINGDGTDNRLANLRAASAVENGRNAKRSKRNKSGMTGVCKEGCGWKAYIKVGYKTIRLGNFKTVEEAAKARHEANVKYGFHPNHGRAPS